MVQGQSGPIDHKRQREEGEELEDADEGDVGPLATAWGTVPPRRGKSVPSPPRLAPVLDNHISLPYYHNIAEGDTDNEGSQQAESKSPGMTPGSTPRGGRSRSVGARQSVKQRDALENLKRQQAEFEVERQKSKAAILDAKREASTIEAVAKETGQVAASIADASMAAIQDKDREIG